jgi:CAP-Gly domain-containing linker protein 1
VISSADSSEQLSKYNDDLRNREKELNEAREKIFQTETALKLTEEKLSDTETELNKNVVLLEQLRSEKSDMKLQIDNAKKSNADYNEKVHEYERKESELLTRLEKNERKESELLARLEESEQIKKNLEEKSNQVVSLLEQLTTKEKEIADFHSLVTELSTSQNEIINLQQSKSKLETDQRANQWAIEELTEKLKVESDKTAKMENTIREKDSKLQDAENRLSELQRMNDSLTIDKATTDKNLNASLNTMIATVEELRVKLQNTEEVVRGKTDELSKAKVESENSHAQIAELNAMISSIKEEYIRNNNKLKNAQETIAQKQSVINELAEIKTTLENSAKLLETQLSNLHEELNKRDEQQAEMEVKMKKSVTSKEEGMLKLRNSMEHEVAVKQQEIEYVNRQNKELDEKLRASQNVADKQKLDLSDKEIIINELKTHIKTLEDAQVEKIKAEQQSRNEEIKLKQNELSSANKRIHELQHVVNTLEKQLKEQEMRSTDLARTMENNEKEVNKNVQNLQEKLSIAKAEETRLLNDLSRLEKEQKQITAKWIEATNQLKLSQENLKNTYDGTGDAKGRIVAKDIDIARLQEENDTAKSQIDFLNSVIVDMQRKNEGLLCKIEVLEMGVPANEAEDYSRSTLNKRGATPRMFCDICDQFDLHETEDCPRQAQDFMEGGEKKMKSKSKKEKKSLERPYCENCEMFGHETRDCDDAEMF